MHGMLEFAQSAWTEDACQQIIDMGLEHPVERGDVGPPGLSPTKDVENVRRCNIRWLVPEPRWQALFQEVESAFKFVNRNLFGFDISFVPEIQFTEYLGTEGGKYDWHKDVHWQDQTKPYHRKISMSVQLSNSFDYEGGDLQFEDIDGPEPELMRLRGSAIMFPSFVSHRVTPVTKGTRYSLVAWMEGPKFR